MTFQFRFLQNFEGASRTSPLNSGQFSRVYGVKITVYLSLLYILSKLLQNLKGFFFFLFVLERNQLLTFVNLLPPAQRINSLGILSFEEFLKL